ncbi:MAG: S1C family serine protease [Gemmatimonadota bacterium]
MNKIPGSLVTAVAVGVGIGAGHGFVTNLSVPQAYADARFEPSADETRIVNIARDVSPAVVSISRRGASGSGVIIQQDGLILTNAHVVGAVREVQVTLADGRRMQGTVLGRDATVDIAVVRVQGRGLPFATNGDSDQLKVGQLAVVIGNPLGLDRTVTTGVISAVDRSPRGVGMDGLIQTDAAIHPGNSGGPVLDSNGRVVGIATMILRSPGGGIGFAIPINLANDVAQQILTTGRVVRAFLGVGYIDIEPGMTMTKAREGILVNQVVDGSPADRGGLRAGDVIVGIEGRPVKQGADFRQLLRTRRPGDDVTLNVLRGGRSQSLRVKLGRAPEM